MLDNTVAGGIPRGYTMYDSMVKECMEEASLAEHVVKSHIKPAGAVSYFYQYGRLLADQHGHLLPTERKRDGYSLK